MRNERICLMCGTHYSFCPHCKESKPEEMWRFLYHDGKCLALSEIWYAYRGNEISKQEAKRRMSKLKPNIDDVLNYTSTAAREIREIFDADKKVEEVNDSDIKQDQVNSENNSVSDDASINEEPNENEPYQESTIIENQNSDESNQIELKYDEYVIANGYTGASDNAYYTRNNTLYHLIISKNETIKIAEGVKKIEDDIDTVLVYKGKNFKIIKEDDYVTYID